MTTAPERICRLSFSNSPDEEFQGPNGEWFSVYRSIVLDSWLTWKDALPGHRLTTALPVDVASAITALAQKIHSAHMQLPDYRRLASSPFRVGRWWDPAAVDEWSQGSKALLRLENYSAQRLASRIPPRLNLRVKQQSEHWLVIALDEHAECPVHSLDYGRVVTSET